MKVQTRTTLEQKMLPLKMNNSVQSKKNITFTAFQKMNSFTYIFKTFCRHFELSCHFLKNQNWPLPRSITVLSDCWLKIWRGKHVNSYQRESFEKKTWFFAQFYLLFPKSGRRWGMFSEYIFCRTPLGLVTSFQNKCS